MPNSEFWTCRDPEFPNTLHFNFMNMPNVEFLNVPLCSAPMSYLVSSKWGRQLCYGHAAVHWCLQRERGCRVRICIMVIAADFKMYLLHYFCSNLVDFFYNTQETQMQKNYGPEFWSLNSVIFWEFLKFSKRRHAVPLRPIWTIMVAAKLEHSRVLVTEFHQNRSTFKGRSAGQRHTHTDRQTNSAENNGPSGLQSGQQKNTV